MQQIVISGFDKTGNMVKPWAEAGYLCYCVDMQHAKREERVGNIIYVRANMLDWLPPRGDVAAAFFFPPCTDVAVSGAKVLRNAREHMGDVDGGDVQDWAEEAGLLVKHRVTESCGEYCVCAEVGFPSDCYRYSDDAAATIAAIAATQQKKEGE